MFYFFRRFKTGTPPTPSQSSVLLLDNGSKLLLDNGSFLAL